jgi:hypothetical protein
MKNRYRLYRRRMGGVFYVHDSETGKQESLGTRDRAEATTLLNARNESVRQPQLTKRRVSQTGAVERGFDLQLQLERAEEQVARIKRAVSAETRIYRCPVS